MPRACQLLKFLKNGVRFTFGQKRVDLRELTHALEKDNIVLSLGGGTPCYGTNMKDILSLSENVIYLKASVKELSQRLQKEKKERPLIKNISDGDLPEFIGKHLFERSSFYQKANFTIDCDGKESEEIVSEIENILI